MNEIKNCIDTALSEMNLSPDFINQITQETKNTRRLHRTPRQQQIAHAPVPRLARAAVAVLCIALLGTSAFAAGSLLYSKISVNQQTMPKLEPMKIIPLEPVDAAANEYGQIKKTYPSMKALQDELGVQLLGADLAADNPYIKIFYTKTGDGFNEIDIREYLLGDLSDIREWNGEEIDTATEGNDEWYVWTQGTIYKRPINLKINILSAPSQQELDMEYMGYFQYVETFTSEQGYTVNVLQDTVAEEQLPGLPDDFVPQTHMIFVADGIQYTLQGRVPIQTMKDIINTME